MNYLNPIYTEKRECQDCYKCLRNCPVKAIKVESGYATVVPEQCIVCGHCVEVCPSGAKTVRDDLPRVRQLLAAGHKTIVSLAPSFVAEFPGNSPGQIIAALRRLGFYGVSETALGAQAVSVAVAETLRTGASGVYISSACPSVVAYLQKHQPTASPRITALLSPLLTHCRMLRQSYGENVRIVFIGPCIAKKIEADTRVDLLDAALTFEDLRRWLIQEKISLDPLQASEEDRFIPETSAEGAWYPVDGGMIAGIKNHCAVNDASFMSFSGITAIQKALDGLDALVADNTRENGGSVFLELLACEGGCVNGPKLTHKAATISKRLRVLRQGRYPEHPSPRPGALARGANYIVQPERPAVIPEAQIREALRAVGKFTADDELNCGGCGYDRCRQFVQALVLQKAEKSMCVTYMRKLAHKKANALIQKMPSAVVIVNSALQILEYNAAFAKLFVPASGAEEPAAALEGAPLSRFVPFQGLFSRVLKTGLDIMDKDLRFKETILHLSIFTIEKHCVIGGIIQDVTLPAVQKEQVIRKAREVIQHNLATVQKIAYLLGENASESEITLSSIIDSFTPPKIEETSVEGDWKKLYKR
jgi:iron only hydrogenase large subunit-like protein/uncharacterized Fe-S cluster-containing protein